MFVLISISIVFVFFFKKIFVFIVKSLIENRQGCGPYCLALQTTERLAVVFDDNQIEDGLTCTISLGSGRLFAIEAKEQTTGTIVALETDKLQTGTAFALNAHKLTTGTAFSIHSDSNNGADQRSFSESHDFNRSRCQRNIFKCVF